MLSYIIPTRDRPHELARTLRAIGSLPAGAHDAIGGAEVVIADNASDPPAVAPARLTNGINARLLRLERNRAAAARNDAAAAARGEWLCMLDDDSHPLDAGHVGAILDAPPDVSAIGAEILLPSGGHEAGGLPEVFIGCGVLLRRDAFLAVGGYDPAFHFYAEEYDCAARLLLAGLRVTHDARFRVLHRKVTGGRDMDAILRRLVRNNAWVAQRYAPPAERLARLRETITRYARIALKENACAGYARGVGELAFTLARQPRAPMPPALWDRFTGVAHARETLSRDPTIALARKGALTVALVHRGKHDWAVERALRELGVPPAPDASRADVLVVGTLSPGPALDALAALERAGETRPVVACIPEALDPLRPAAAIPRLPSARAHPTPRPREDQPVPGRRPRPAERRLPPHRVLDGAD